MITINFDEKIISTFLTSIFTLMIFSYKAYSWVWVSSELSDSEVESWIASIEDIPKEKIGGLFYRRDDGSYCRLSFDSSQDNQLLVPPFTQAVPSDNNSENFEVGTVHEKFMRNAG